MKIEKNGNEYSVRENRDHWVVSRIVGALTIEYKIPKDVCEDEAAVRAYVEAEAIF